MASDSATNLTNQFLIAMPGMADDNFAGSVVYLCEHTERGFVLHERGEDDAADIDADGATYTSSLRIPGGMAMTTSKDVLEALASGAGPKRVLVTLGYAGWSAGQLEDEIARNGWITVDAQPEVIFETPIEQRYDKALSLLGIDPRMLSSEAGHA